MLDKFLRKQLAQSISMSLESNNHFVLCISIKSLSFFHIISHQIRTIYLIFTVCRLLYLVLTLPFLYYPLFLSFVYFVLYNIRIVFLTFEHSTVNCTNELDYHLGDSSTGKIAKPFSCYISK